MTSTDPSGRDIRVLAFDTFGTLTDWFSGVTAEIREELPSIDAGEFARERRRRYAPILGRVESGELPWRELDDLQAETLGDTANLYGVRLSPDSTTRLVLAWHRIPAWSEVAAALTRLRGAYRICALSNGSTELLGEIAAHNGFEWDFIGGSDVWKHYKPAPETYLGLVERMGVTPSQVMMVATHQFDLDAARGFGLRTAFVERPREWGGEPKDDSGSPANDVHAVDLTDLADQLLN